MRLQNRISKQKMKEYVPCVICNSDNSSSIYSRESINIVKCTKCGLMYQNPRVSQNLVNEETNRKDYYKIYEKIAQDQEKFFRNRFETVLKGIPTGKVLDVGCGTGGFLKVAKDLGWDVYGVEVSSLAAHASIDKLGIGITEGTVEEANYPNEYFDLVNMSHVLEHMPNPLKTLKEIKRITKPPGYLLIEVPNEKNFKIRNFLLNLFLHSGTGEKFAPRNYHLYLFTKDTLASLIDKSGFKLLLIEEEGFGVKGREDWILKSLNPFIRTLAFFVKRLQLDVHIRLGHYLIALAKNNK